MLKISSDKTASVMEILLHMFPNISTVITQHLKRIQQVPYTDRPFSILSSLITLCNLHR